MNVNAVVKFLGYGFCVMLASLWTMPHVPMGFWVLVPVAWMTVGWYVLQALEYRESRKLMERELGRTLDGESRR